MNDTAVLEKTSTVENNQELQNFIHSLVEVILPQDDDFLKVKETLTRIGIPATLVDDNGNRNGRALRQTCHILHKSFEGKSRYYIMHFKELFMLDGRLSDFSETDKTRRNLICNLLEDWNLIKIIDPAKTKVDDKMTLAQLDLRVLPYSQKEKWKLSPMYNIGKRKRVNKN